MPVIAVVAFGLVSVIVSVEVPPAAIVAGANALADEMPPTTVSTALAAVPVPAFVVVTAPVELVYAPTVLLVTFTVTVHEPLAGTVPVASATLVPPTAAVTAPPAQVVAPAGVPVFTRPAGYLSLTAAPLIAVVFALVGVMVRTEVAPGKMEFGAKALPTVGAPSTVSEAVAAATLAPPLVVVRPPA